LKSKIFTTAGGGSFMKRSLNTILFFILIFWLVGISQSSAGTVLKIDFNSAVNGSELIFEGTVISKETRISPISRIPFTYLNFKIIDVIKGSYSDPTIEIGFMGGSLGDETLIVSDMRMPKIGERGIYFVESLSKQQIHPLIGWQQGHYLVISNPQTEIDEVVPVEQEGLKESRSKTTPSVTVEEFKTNIRNVIEGGQ